MASDTFVIPEVLSGDEFVEEEEFNVKQISKKYKKPGAKSQSSKISFTIQDKWVKRVIAPYIITRDGRRSVISRDKNYYNFFFTKKSSLLMRNLKNYVANKNDLPALIYETAEVMKTLTNSLGVRLYFVDQGKDQLYQYQKHVRYPRCRVNYDLATCNSVACYVARTREYVLVDDVFKDSRFPDGISYKHNVKPVLCLPVVTLETCYAVIELYRESTQEPYDKNNLKLGVILCGWMGITIQEIQEGSMLHQKQVINTDLLHMVMAYYANPDSLETLLSEIVSCAKKEVKAEKGSIYVVVDIEKTLADVYEEGITDKYRNLIKKKRSVNYGDDNTVVSHAAKEMKTINVKNLCSDSSSYRKKVSIDANILMIHRTELCVPIISNNILLGMISVINKANDDYFTLEDEEIIEEIATYTGLALFYARAQRKIVRAELKYMDALELLQYHLKPCEAELEMIVEEENLVQPSNFDDFNYYVMGDDYAVMPHLFIKMIRILIPEKLINFEDFYPFVMTTQRSYRKNPYHNFEHAFLVSHTIYNILIRNMDKFSIIERQALMIAAFTHDIDHYGVTNNFLVRTNHYLAQLYDDSILENHHCFVTAQLLRKYKLFKNITGDIEEAFLKEVHENIIYTDMVYYFKNRKQLLLIINNDDFDIHHPLHKVLTRNVCMTMADLSGQTKPFSISKRLTDALYHEFYAQGDREKEFGYTPLAMMDRDGSYHVPDDQAQFVGIVVMSCADLLRQILPNTEELYYNAEMLRDTWRRIIDSRGDKLWRQCDSIPS